VDDIDMAQVEIDRHLQNSIRTKKKEPNLSPQGYCHYCEEEFQEDSAKLFCGSVCADNFDTRSNGCRRL
jgi:hypothetical protein